MAIVENSPGNLNFTLSNLRIVSDEFSGRNIRVDPIYVMLDPADMLDQQLAADLNMIPRIYILGHYSSTRNLP